MRYPIPYNEGQRLGIMKELDLIDSDYGLQIHGILEIIKIYFDVPVVIMTLINKDQQYFLSEIGMGVKETSRHLSFCTYTILRDEVLVINNALEDERFKENKLVLDYPNIRFYAGTPIKFPDTDTDELVNIATIAIISDEPRTLTEGMKNMLRDFGKLLTRKIIDDFRPELMKDYFTKKDWLNFCSWCRNNFLEPQDLTQLLNIFEKYFDISHGMCRDCFQAFEKEVLDKRET